MIYEDYTHCAMESGAVPTVVTDDEAKKDDQFLQSDSDDEEEDDIDNRLLSDYRQRRNTIQVNI